MATSEEKLTAHFNALEKLEEITSNPERGLTIYGQDGQQVEFEPGTDEYRGVLIGIKIALQTIRSEASE